MTGLSPMDTLAAVACSQAAEGRAEQGAPEVPQPRPTLPYGDAVDAVASKIEPQMVSGQQLMSLAELLASKVPPAGHPAQVGAMVGAGGADAAFADQQQSLESTWYQFWSCMRMIYGERAVPRQGWGGPSGPMVNTAPAAPHVSFGAPAVHPKVEDRRCSTETSPTMGVAAHPAPATAPAEKVCKNCGTTTTPFWRKDKLDNMPLCNACGLYLAKNQAHRPQQLWDPTYAATHRGVP